MEKIKVVIVAGPTGVGKTTLATELSRRFDAEIVSADSMQLYRYMDIGTAKPTLEEREAVRHHMIDVADPDEDYNASRYSEEAASAVEEIRSRGKNVFIVGGTGLYIRALLGGIFPGPGRDDSIRKSLEEEADKKGARALYQELASVDPVSAERIHENNVRRVIRALEVYRASGVPISELQRAHGFSQTCFDALKLAVTMDKASLYQAIDARVEHMVNAGLVEETEALLKRGYSPSLKSMQALGYKEIVAYLCGGTDLEHAVAEIKKNTRRYAKRQYTWFNKDKEYIWFDAGGKTDIIKAIDEFLD